MRGRCSNWRSAESRASRGRRIEEQHGNIHRAVDPELATACAAIPIVERNIAVALEVIQ